MGYVFNKSGVLKYVSGDAWDKAGDDGSYIVIFDRGQTSDGRTYWLYIGVNPAKYKEFLRQSVRRMPMKYQNYGTILRYGFDKEVPPAVREEMKAKYGSNSDYQKWIEDSVEKEKQQFRKEKEAQEDKRIGNIVAMLKQKQAN